MLNGVDVSDQYESQVPFVRYIVEPIRGIANIFGFNNDPTDSIVFIIVIVITLRIIIFIFDHTVWKNSQKKELMYDFVKDILRFTLKYGSLVLGIFGLIALFGYFLFGFLFLANYFQTIFHLGSAIGVLLILGKIAYSLFMFSHPYLTIKIKKKRTKNKAIKLIKNGRDGLALIWIGFIVLFSLNFTLFSQNYPTQVIIADLDDDEFIFDFHVHTTFSDGILTPEQRVMWYIDQGIKGAAFSDHHNPRGAMAAREFVEQNNLDFKVFIGQEWTSDGEGLHCNVFGIEEDLTPEDYYGTDHHPSPYTYTPNLMNTSEMISWVKARGGFVIVNHYSNSPPGNPYTYDQLRDWGVDGFEIHGGGLGRRNIRDYCLANNLACFSNSDDHGTKSIERFTRFRLADPSNLTLANIFATLKNNTHQCVQISTPNHWNDNVPEEIRDWFDDLRQLERFYNYFHNLDQYQILSWIIWSFVAYLLAMILIKKIKSIDLEKLQRKIVYT